MLEPHEVISVQNKGPYTFRAALIWCVVEPMKDQQLDAISCNRIGVMKTGPRDTAQHHFEIEKKCEDFGVNEGINKMYMIDFNKLNLKSDHPIIRKLEGISNEGKTILRIMEKKTCKMGNHYQIPLSLQN